MSERLALAETIFHEVVEAPPEERAAMLAERTAGDPELRCLVERLLAHDQGGMGAFLSSPAGTVAAQPARTDTPSRIGPYRIVSMLAEGGMGTVYRARQAPLAPATNPERSSAQDPQPLDRSVVPAVARAEPIPPRILRTSCQQGPLLVALTATAYLRLRRSTSCGADRPVVLIGQWC